MAQNHIDKFRPFIITCMDRRKMIQMGYKLEKAVVVHSYDVAETLAERMTARARQALVDAGGDPTTTPYPRYYLLQWDKSFMPSRNG